MAPVEIDLRAIARGTITAPAGCGKTQLIAHALASHRGAKPILVLTHTNAGVAALRGRLDRAGVPTSAYRLSTIDGWAIRLISTFPGRSAHDPVILRLTTPSRDYPAIRAAAWKLLQAGHVSEVLKASYAHLVVDEYQDCSVPQHHIVYFLSLILPTCVLGDPMQAIFGFRGNELADWNQQVCVHFPVVGELATPWRWRNAGAEALGQWLLEARRLLAAGHSVDLRSGPPEHVTWLQTVPPNDHAQRLTQDALGVAIGLDEGPACIRISRYESGVHHPSLEVLSQLAEALQVPPAFLVTEDDRLAHAILRLYQLSKADPRQLDRLLGQDDLGSELL